MRLQKTALKNRLQYEIDEEKIRATDKDENNKRN